MQPELTHDVQMVERALSLARRGEGLVEPNPMVGCVIAAGERILGEGWHRRFGGNHAEIEALQACSAAPRGATAYVTLEPCHHFGKTPPCTQALIAAGISRVVIPFIDPNPLVSGKGIRALRRAGLRVDVGILKDRARRLLAPFATRCRCHRPYVIAKWAETADGSLVSPPGKSKWISCPASRRRVHRLRARVDAIIVGVNTILADDPMLTARDVPMRRVAMRVVLDSRLRVPRTCQLVRSADRFATVVFTSVTAARSRKAGQLKEHGVDVIGFRLRRGRLPLMDVLHSDVFQDATNLLVEGGPTLLNAVLSARLVDEAHIYRSRKAYASAGRSSRLTTVPTQYAVSVPEPSNVRTVRSGSDTLRILRFDGGPQANALFDKPFRID